MYFLFAAACFIGAMCGAAFNVAVLGHYDPKFGVAGSVLLHAPFFAVGSVAPLLGFALASRLDAHQPSFVSLSGLMSGIVAYGLLIAVDTQPVSLRWLIGVPLVWLFVAGILFGWLSRERQRSGA